MSGTYGVTVTAETNVALVAGDNCRIKNVQIKASAGALGRGTVMAVNTNTYLWEQYDPDGTDGLNVARGILVEDVANAAVVQPGLIYCQGLFQASGLTWPTGISDAAQHGAELGLADRGIHLDRNLALTTTTTTTTTSTTTTTTTTV